MKLKVIKQSGQIFLIRLSLPIKNGSIKIHVLLNSDIGYAHKHPWNFTSILVFGAYKEILDGKLLKHGLFSKIKRKASERHKVILYKIFGASIPCITIGKYSKKIQPWCEHQNLCEHCTTLGYCMDKKYWEEK
jgi:hypothetical protein